MPPEIRLHHDRPVTLAPDLQLSAEEISSRRELLRNRKGLSTGDNSLYMKLYERAKDRRDEIGIRKAWPR